LIPLHEIKRREYFCVLNHGYLQAKGEKAWAFVMPGLKTINPADFQYAAEFLSTGDFGIRTIDDSNRDIAIAECIAAWKVGDELGMLDLLELVMEKSQKAMPWTDIEVTIFSSVVYQTGGSFLDSHETMKDLLAGYIADNFYEMLSRYGDDFTDPFRRRPELERDVFSKLAAAAEKRKEVEDELD
jgi:hypothetical protein